MTIAEGQE